MRYSTALLAVASLAGLVSAQNYSTSGPLSIDASQMPSALRQSWCRGQINNCPLICGDNRASPNSCDANQLTYQCTCTNGNQPNISDYRETLPFYICSQWRINCVANHPNDLTGQTACQSVVCGTKNASLAVTVSVTSTTAGSIVSATSSVTTTASTGSTSASAATATATRGAAVAMQVAEHYGTGIVAAGVLAAFGLAL